MSDATPVTLGPSCRSRTDAVATRIGGEPVEVEITWQPDLLTPKPYRDFVSAAQGDVDIAAALISLLVKSWSLVDEEGEMIPLDGGSLDERVPVGVIMDVARAMAEAAGLSALLG